MALKLGFSLVAPDASNHVGVTTVSEIWDNINNQWLSVTVAGGGGVTYTAGDGINISSGNVLSVKAATGSAYGGIKTGATETYLNRAVTLDVDGKAYVEMPVASNVMAGISMLSGSANITTDITNEVETKAVTPKALGAFHDSKIWVGTQAQYDAIQTKDANKFYMHYFMKNNQKRD